MHSYFDQGLSGWAENVGSRPGIRYCAILAGMVVAPTMTMHIYSTPRSASQISATQYVLREKNQNQKQNQKSTYQANLNNAMYLMETRF